ncbi:exopolysaccharide biosynthesis polyprenyl glycosylphosphotransferase [Verrucomicrobia bacterium]|nr:exopolysaccharide biosynthesis polyprenyl glycosylphosphotransferase [Verrucomicrobiota bacterium]
MVSGGILGKHWVQVAFAFFLDATIICTAFMLGTAIRFKGAEFWFKLGEYGPSIAAGALFFSSANYVFALYEPSSIFSGKFRRSLLLFASLCLSIGFMFAMFYGNYSGRIGRGVMLVSIPAAYALTLIHHASIYRRLRSIRDRIAFILTCEADELELPILMRMSAINLDLAGVVTVPGYTPSHDVQVLGSIKDLSTIAEKHNISRVVCTNFNLDAPGLFNQYCRLRYAGVNVMPLVNLVEETFQLIPLELVTSEWLLNASAGPGFFYIRKLKRAFDIITSLLGLVFLGPLLLIGMLWVKIVSPGPVFYRQVRSGRFAKPYEVIKLRSMRLDAEKQGAQWAAKDKDPRVFPGGGLLRKYRIDEIPQLFNVFKGEMSFVGPRPERPEFIGDLVRDIPFFRERLLVQPGITGWAQVNYPYGASVDDARRKLELDLYYMKHMSIVLDLFILLDTVRIILMGGVGKTTRTSRARRAVDPPPPTEASREVAKEESAELR